MEEFISRTAVFCRWEFCKRWIAESEQMFSNSDHTVHKQPSPSGLDPNPLLSFPLDFGVLE